MTKLATSLFAVILATSLGGCVMQRDHEALAARTEKAEKSAADTAREAAALRADLEATRQRLDNALRANADSSTDVMSSKQRLNDLAGRLDEAQHAIEELRRELAASRTELYARIDELKRGQPGQAPAPQVTTPADRAGHFTQLKEAHARKDWATVRVLGPDYVNRYPSDERADEALYFVGEADLLDGRPSAALGHFNRLLKLFPRSAQLGPTLVGMGDAYLLMHDCANAKLAFEAAEKRFPKDKVGADARGKLQTIARNPPGLCAPP